MTGRGAWAFAERLVRESRSLEAAGAPLPDGLRLMAADCRGPRRMGLLAAAERMESGADPADALADAQLLPPDVAAMIRAGTAGGDMARCLDAASNYLRARRRATHALAVALCYPAFVLTAAAVVPAIVTFGAMPAILATLREIQADPAAAMHPLIAVSLMAQRILAGLFWAAWLVCCTATLVTLFAPRTAAVARLLSWIPLHRRYVDMHACHQFAAATGSMLRAGLPLGEALRAQCAGTAEPSLCRLPSAALTAIERGLPMSDGVERTGFFPAAELALLQAAEQQEELDMYLRGLEERSLARLERLRDILANAGVPVVIVLGVLVALYVLAVAAPLLSMRLWIPY